MSVVPPCAMSSTPNRHRGHVPLEPRRKRGLCRLCGDYLKLTKTHIPARSAGNTGPARAPIIELDDSGRRVYGLSAERLGGMAGYWFCETCNNERTRPWDEEYVRWLPEFGRLLHDPGAKGNTVRVGAVDFDPGAFARCLWAWFFAVCDGLLNRAPDIARAVRTGEAVTPDRFPRVYLAATRESNSACSASQLELRSSRRHS
jgi:hypothetical protein